MCCSEPGEDEWLVLLSKHSGNQWVKKTASKAAKLQPLPTKTDKDTLSQPYSLEGGSVSLGDQFTECEQVEDIPCQPDFSSVSPPDKEFLLPKSLSEELTQEMRDLKQKHLDETDGNCLL